MKREEILIIAVCISLFISCAYFTTKQESRFKSYTLNVIEQKSTGDTMITSESAVYTRISQPTGLSEEQESWQTLDYPSKDSFKEELVYQGRSDNTLHILYKKYGKASSSPDFSEELTYDIGNSDIVQMRNYRIRVLNATAEYIRFQVLGD